MFLVESQIFEVIRGLLTVLRGAKYWSRVSTKDQTVNFVSRAVEQNSDQRTVRWRTVRCMPPAANLEYS